MHFNPLTIDLLITQIIPEVKDKLISNNTLIINAPPGAGKSTLLPLALIDEPWLAGKKIIMLEPRRLAARTIAHRMSSLWGDTVGQTIGYRIRFENKVSIQTKIEVVTEGILTRMLQSDNALEDVGLIIFDEFHERSIYADVALALSRECQQILRPELRMMIMSATLNMPVLEALLKAPSIISEGRQYPVEIKYVGGQDQVLLSETAARTIVTALNENDGDVLAFFPGEGEIRKCAEILKRELRDFAIHPLYGQLPQHEQLAAILPNKFGKRKIVLATSIAETSLTIEGIKVVVDTGFGRSSRFDPKSGLSRLETIQITKDAADQRAGRAGRLSPGVCYRMWTAATHNRLAENRQPEILDVDLCDLMLDMAQWGVQDINQLSWLTLPPKAHVQQANDTLHQIGALENNVITEHGKQVHQLACHPRLAHMLLMAKEHGSLSLATDVAAILEERDPLPKELGIDINLRIEALRRARNTQSLGKRFARIEKVAESYRRMLDAKIDDDAFDIFETGFLIAQAYPERIACARPGNNAQFQLANGRFATAGHKDELAHEPWLAIAHIDARDGLGKIFMASPLNPKDLVPLVKEKEVITWDTYKGGLIASKDLRIGSIVLQSKPLNNPNPSLVLNAVSNAIMSEGEDLLTFSDAFIQLQNRISSLKLWNPKEDWPDVSLPHLLQINKEWLGEVLGKIKTTDDLEEIQLAPKLLNLLTWEQQELLRQLAPEKIDVPSGSSIQIQYSPNGETPILSVRLQELFGLQDTPKINRGNTSLVIHLLSPGYKPVQVTSDLRSFWNNTYHEVKKELQRRYPKHAWPEDPWLAKPVAKGNSKRTF